MVALEVQQLAKQFSGVQALSDVDLSLEEGEIVGLVGPNGSGKTTLFNCITGFARASKGRVSWRGEDITSLAPDQIARLGVVRTFQQTMVFPRTTVRENASMALLSGARAARRTGRPPIFGDVQSLLEFFGIAGLEDYAAADIPFGSARKLGVGLALATNPQLLLLDEPAAGLNQDETQELSSLVSHIRNLGVTVCVIEHDMELVMSLCERVVVLHAGRKIAEGRPAEVANHPEVVTVYLGERFARNRRDQ
jgi:ABC-type branched-subunit amino acid transport system ATPase component